MTRIRPDQLLLPSVLDRLIDEEPDVQTETERTRSQKLRDLKLSVRRDLEQLLNTRICLREVPEDCEQVLTSVLNYGIPDFGGAAMGSRDQQEILRSRVEEVIRRFETRFKRVRVELVNDPDNVHQRVVQFRIDGMLYAEPAPEPVVFDSMLSPLIGQFEVKASDS